MARQPEPEKAPNHERWLVSFADFMTLLFALFVVLYATAKGPDKGKQIAYSEAFQTAMSRGGIFISSGRTAVLGAPSQDPGADVITIEVKESPEGLPTSVLRGGDDDPFPDEEDPYLSTTPTDPLDAPVGEEDPWGTPEPEEPGGDPLRGGTEGDPNLAELYENLQEALKNPLLNRKIEIRKERRGVVISLSEAGFFSSGSADLKPRSLETIDEIADELLGMGRGIVIRIEGHTDNVRLSPRSRFGDNRELSTGRALSVIRRFERRGYPASHLVSSGYGEHKPVATNHTVEGRARNRRVDIVILSAEFAGLEASGGQSL